MSVVCGDVCLSCGNELKVKERWLLGSDFSKHVLQIWRSFFKEKLEELEIQKDVDTDSLVKGSGDEKRQERYVGSAYFQHLRGTKKFVEALKKVEKMF